MQEQSMCKWSDGVILHLVATRWPKKSSEFTVHIFGVQSIPGRGNDKYSKTSLQHDKWNPEDLIM